MLWTLVTVGMVVLFVIFVFAGIARKNLNMFIMSVVFLLVSMVTAGIAVFKLL